MKKKILVIAEPLIRLSFAQDKNYCESNHLNYFVGGDGLNVSCLLSSLDNDTYLLGAVPFKEQDFFSESVFYELKKFGVHTNFLVETFGRIGKYFFAFSDDFTSAKVLYDRENSSFVNLELQSLEDKILEKKFHLVHISGISLYSSPRIRKMFLNLLEKLKSQNTLISLDLNYRQKLWNSYGEFKQAIIPFVELADIVFGWLNENDNFNILDFSKINSAEEIQQLIHHTMNEYDLKVITAPLRISYDKWLHGVKSFAYYKKQLVTANEIRFEPKYSIGAGDSYVATFLDAFLKKQTIHNAILYGRNAYAIKHIYEGDINLASKSQIQNVLLINNTKISR